MGRPSEGRGGRGRGGGCRALRCFRPNPPIELELELARAPARRPKPRPPQGCELERGRGGKGLFLALQPPVQWVPPCLNPYNLQSSHNRICYLACVECVGCLPEGSQSCEVALLWSAPRVRRCGRRRGLRGRAPLRLSDIASRGSVRRRADVFRLLVQIALLRRTSHYLAT